jgi:hypothetical protein
MRISILWMGCFQSQRRPLQNWRSGSSAESRILNFIGKCGGLPTRRYDGGDFCRDFRWDSPSAEWQMKIEMLPFAFPPFRWLYPQLIISAAW